MTEMAGGKSYIHMYPNQFSNQAYAFRCREWKQQATNAIDSYIKEKKSYANGCGFRPARKATSALAKLLLRLK